MIIDFHAHILPHTDHGCDGSRAARQQLQLMRRGGTDAVVATPHFYPNNDSVRSFLRRREGAISAMRRKLPLEDLPTVYPAAEVLVCVGMHEMEGLESLAVAGTNVILLEMPFSRWNDALIDTVLGVKARGLCPILAHIDRYPLEDVGILLQAGIRAQVNAEVFAAFKNPKPYVDLMREGAVVALGSDLHGAKRAHYARFVRVRKRLGTVSDTVFAATEKLLRGAKSILDTDREHAEFAT